MSCVEKRHMSHRAGSMLHHRFPNGFTDLFMDETDREVSTLTDRAFRSLCVGDDAVYNDELSYGFSPFSCHKPLVGEPVKKTHHKESKKQGQNKNDKNYAQPWKQQQQMSHMSSFLKVLSATEESCKGMLNKNGGMTDTNGESWDKSALRSIQRELSDFSSDYHTNLPDGHYKNRLQHQSGDCLSNKTSKDGAPPSGKSSKNKNGKSNVKLRKLNIKNFFLHSELSPFQTWRDFKQFPFGQEDTVLSADNIPKWYDLTFYKELTEAHRKENLHIEEAHSCQKVASEPPPPTAPKPTPPPPPPKVLLKPTTTPAEKRCSSEGGDGTAAPWRRNRSRAKSVIPASQPGIPPQENCSETVDESLFWVKKEARSVEVKAVEEVSSLASTPFSICQLMTPVIPSRQPTETSEILQGVLSPSALDLPIRPHSEAKLTPEPPIKRDSYKSLASSILFNLKDNRKRVKSRYSPPKFKTLEVPEGVTESPQSDSLKQPHTGSECNASGLSTPAILIEGQAVCSPVLDSNSTPTIVFTKRTTDRPLSDDYLLSNLLQTKWEAPGNSSIDEENPISPLLHSKKNKSPMAKKQNYPSLNLYRKANPVDSDMKYLHVPLSPGASIHIDQPTETNELSPLTLNKGVSPKAQPTKIGLSPNTLNVNKDCSPKISPHTFEKEGLSSTVSVGKRLPNVPDKSKRSVKDIKENNFGAQPVSSKEKDTSGQPICTMDVIKAAREAIHAVKNKAVSAVQSDNMNKPISYKEELREKQKDEKVALSKETFSSKRESSVPENNNALSQSRNEAALVGKKGNVRKEPPPVPKRNLAKSDIQVSLDKQQTHNVDTLTNGDPGDGKLEYESVQKQEKLKHLFSARQNNYIKYQRYAETNDEQGDKFEEGDLKVNTKVEGNEERTSSREARDSEHIINDLHALKGLERARRGDRTHDNAKNKLGLIKIDEEARAKNDLISRELRNIKKGMLSMRGNTLAKREIFVNKEKEQIKPEAFTKIDSKVIVNKTLLNDNYDKAKMALEEIISDRQKNNTFSEQDANPILDENASNESYVTRVQQHKKDMRDSMADVKEKQNGNSFALKENDLKERLGDLRDHNHMRQILSQKDPKFGDPNSLAGRIVLPGMDKIDNEQNTILTTNVDDKLTDDPNYELEERNLRHIVRQKSEEGGEYMMNHNGGKKGDAPCVPPRSKRGGDKGDGSINMETYNLKDLGEKDIFNKNAKYDYGVVQEMSSAVSNKQDVDRKEPVPSQSEIRSDKEEWDVMNTANSTGTDAVKCQSIVPSKYTQSENRLHLSPEFGGHENNADKMQANMSPTREATSENRNARAPETYKLKRKAPLKPDHLNTPNVTVTNNLPAEDPYKIIRQSEEIHVDTDALSEVPMNLTSPLLLVNGVISQSPPDQSSLSSKSSYFSVESALYRNNETESNVYHSLENLYGEVGEVTETISQNRKQDSGRMEGEYYNFSDHESEPEAQKLQIKSPQKETKVPHKESREKKQGRENTTKDQSLTQEENNQTPMSPPNTFSPTLDIPALFKVKDNTFIKKLKKTVQPWSRRGSLSGSEKGEEGIHQEKATPELPPATLPATGGSKLTPDEIFEPKEISNSSKPLLPSPSNLHRENPNKPQFGDFLTVPQDEDRYSGVSPSSEGMESYATSAGDTADDMGLNGSTCSGNESQTGLPKPPAVLPKSDKAVLKAIKLTTRRKKKEDAQKSPHRSTQSSSRNKVDRHKDEKSEQISSSKSSKSSERKDREKTEDGQRHSESQHGKNSDNLCDQVPPQRRGHNNKNEHHDRTDLSQQTQRQSHDSVENNNQGKEALSSVATERQGRSSNRRIREKPQQRHYSSDRVISNVPVYKALNDRPTSDRQFQRSQSYDRYQGSKVERRLSADVSVNEKLDPRTQRKLSSDMSVSEKLEPRSQRIEKSIMDELQQRGRAREKVSRGNPARRSHSIDAYSSEVPHPSTLSRQSSHNSHTSHTSHTSQLSRQSSIEHAIVTQSFPMTQRKLLQDPDSGQYFFVDMPIQVKTKTFFDPETGSYVQLPVQPREGAVPQASPLEVLTPPMVVYHSFVPVPLSPMAQQAPIQAPHMTPEEFEQRHLERSRPIHYKERNPYLEPVYGQHDHMIGEFQGTEELDCPS